MARKTENIYCLVLKRRSLLSLALGYNQGKIRIPNIMCWELWFLYLIPNQIRFSVIPGMTAVSELGHTHTWPLLLCLVTSLEPWSTKALFWVPREKSRDLWCLLPHIDWWCFVFRILFLYAMRDVKEDGRHSASLQNRGCRVEELWLDLSSEDKRNEL